MKGFIEMAELIIKTALSDVGINYDLIDKKLKLTFGKATLLINFEKNISLKTNQNLKGHFIEFIINSNEVRKNEYNEQKDIKIIHIEDLELQLENAKKLNSNFIDELLSDRNNNLYYII